MHVQQQVVVILEETLGLGERAETMERTAALFGALPELDSMSVMGVIAGLEERFGFSVSADEIDSATFATVGSLTDFVSSKLSASQRESFGRGMANELKAFLIALFPVAALAFEAAEAY